MFESAELGHKVDKATFDAEAPKLREALLEVQAELAEKAKFPVVILIGGVDGAGKGETVNLLNEWMDPRHIRTHAMGSPSDEERERPAFFRFWRALPPKGKIGIFFGSWYTAPIVDRALGTTKGAELDRALEEIVRFERMLTDEGALVLKFWFHLSKKAQRARLKELEKSAKTRWRVTTQDWENFERYDKFYSVSERALRHTSRAEAPWIVVEGQDARYRSLTVAKTILESLKKRLEEGDKHATASIAPPVVPTIDRVNVLQTLDMSRTLDKKAYDDELEALQGKLALLVRDAGFARKKSAVLVFEGSDAAGKGGAIRRVTGALDARQYAVVPIAAPTEEERAQPYLWRFWRHVPRRGRLTIFDRSWYGRVLVERVEGFCKDRDWLRAYSEINDFEEQLDRNGTLVVKFWLHIDKDVQLERFQQREQIGFKRYKITPEDWRNREKWDAYERAVSDMVDRTSTEVAPWTLVPAKDKHVARIHVLKTLCDRLEEVV
jgi:polyphosphate:AMP phosphotransferase